jgi:hypothetical protein
VAAVPGQSPQESVHSKVVVFRPLKEADHVPEALPFRRDDRQAARGQMRLDYGFFNAESNRPLARLTVG